MTPKYRELRKVPRIILLGPEMGFHKFLDPLITPVLATVLSFLFRSNKGRYREGVFLQFSQKKSPNLYHPKGQQIKSQDVINWPELLLNCFACNGASNPGQEKNRAIFLLFQTTPRNHEY